MKLSIECQPTQHIWKWHIKPSKTVCQFCRVGYFESTMMKKLTWLVAPLPPNR